MLFKPPGRSASSSTLHLLMEGVRDSRSCLCLTSPAVHAQGNRFTCPGGFVDGAVPLPASVTDGLVCYTGAANAMPIGATANLGAFTSHNVTDFLHVAGAHYAAGTSANGVPASRSQVDSSARFYLCLVGRSFPAVVTALLKLSRSLSYSKQLLSRNVC